MISSRHILLIGILGLCQITFAQLRFYDVSDAQNFPVSLTGDTHGSGVAAGDFDNDGDIDIYQCTERGTTDYLFRNDGSSFEEIGDQVGLASEMRGRMALWIDVNSDGELDLLVAGDCDYDEDNCENDNLTRLYLQNNGQFTDISERAGLFGFGPIRNDQTLGGMAAADINLDGWVDFVIAIRNGPLQVFLNQRNETFIESAHELGFDTLDYNFYQPMFYDFDENGLVDLYCNVDFDHNQFWTQESYGQFQNRARVTRCDSKFNEMGMALGDYDRDGDMDIYATNIDNFLGQDGAHNILLQNNLSLTGYIGFTEVSEQLGVDEGGWGWGTTVFDANNDGWLDIAATNGWDRPFDVIDTSKFWIRQPLSRYHDISDSVGFNDNYNSTTLVSLDYDRDGDLDMIQTLKGFTEPNQTMRLLRNDLSKGEKGNYLVVKPRMNGNNKFALGALLKVYIGDVMLLRTVQAGTSFYGQEPYEAFFGLGDSEMVDRLEIIWPGGARSYWDDLMSNQIIVLNDDQVLHSPTGLTGQGLGSRVELNWNDYSQNEDGFVLERSNGISFAQSIQINLAPNTTHYIDSDLEQEKTYYYRIKAMAGLSESSYSSTVEIYTNVLRESSEFEKQISVYPNPIGSNSRFVLINTPQPIDQVRIYDLRGRLLLSQSNPSRKNDSKTQIDVRSLPNGIYILRADNYFFRLMIQK